MFSGREIQDTPCDREAMALITREYGHADIAESAEIDYLNFVWACIARNLAVCEEPRFAKIDDALSKAADALTSNIGPYVRDRLGELLVLIVDWRWISWARAEEAAGRNPYLTV